MVPQEKMSLPVCTLFIIFLMLNLVDSFSFQLQSPQTISRQINLFPSVPRKISGHGIPQRPPRTIRKSMGSDGYDDDDKSPEKKTDKNIFESLIDWAKSEEGKEDLKIYATSFTVALFVRFFIAEPRWIPSLSMYPTFDIGDQLAVDKISKLYRPYQRRDVVVFMPPESFKSFSSNTEALIKRIVAVEGDVVEIKRSGKLYINGELQEERYTAEDAFYTFGPYKVPMGSVLVLGDNRNHSLDGHIWGSLPKENIIGRAVFKYWPPWRIGSVAN